jgi:GntR family transcriptional regulator
VARGVDPMTDRPVYKQIADALRDEIKAGVFEPGARLPSEAQLVERFGVSQGTVRQGLALLRSDGAVVAEHGRGVFVRQQPKIRRVAYDRFSRRHRKEGKAAYFAEAEQMDVKPSVDVFFVGPKPVESPFAERLGMTVGDQVLIRSRRYSSDDQPTELATSYIPWDLASGTQMEQVDPGPGGIYARLEETGHELGRFTEDVSARMPTGEEAKALRLAPGIPVLTLVRVAFDVDGRAVEVCDTVMSADRFLLTYELPAD